MHSYSPKHLLCLLACCFIGTSLLSAATFTVINTNDSGPGSLRAAMTSANASNAADDIVFNIPGMAPHIIPIGSTTGISLPQCNTSSGKLTIDGSTQPANGYTGNSPKIILDGSDVMSGSDQDGLNIWGTGSEIYGLFIRNFPHHGIAMAADNAIIGAPGRGNVITGNGDNGVYIFIVTNDATVQSNLIGVGPDSVTAMGNSDDGVHIWQSSNGNLIGGNTTAKGNIIAYNDNGIYVRSGVNNRISHNSLFCNAAHGIHLATFSPGGNNNYSPPSISTGNPSGCSGAAAAGDIVEIFRDDNCVSCEGKNFIATVTADSAGFWSYSGPLSGTITTTATDPVNFNTSIFSSCLQISVLPPAPVADFTADTRSFCPSGCVTFTDASTGSPTSWSWSFPGGNPATSNLQNPGLVCYDSAGNFGVGLSVSNASGVSAVGRPGYITVFPAPSPGLGVDTSFCTGDSVLLTAAGGGSYFWMPGGQTTASIVVAPPSATAYAVTVTDSNGCSGSDTVTVSQNTLPTVSLGNDTMICNACTLMLLGGSLANTYLWSTGATSTSITVNTTGTYSVIVTDSNGCSASDTILVDVNPVGIADDALASWVSLYPNPGQGDLHLEVTAGPTAWKFEIYDLLGQVVFATDGFGAATQRIALGALAEGVYAWRISGGGMVESGKLVRLR